MLEKLYSKYFQKSRSFLYPALGIARESPFTPTGTYMSLEGLYAPEDGKLICCFKPEDTEAFKTFEEQLLTGNPLFVQKVQIEDYTAYVFDYDPYIRDWDNVILGRYSQLSPVLKRAIKTFYAEAVSEYPYIDSFLFPEKHFEVYGKILDISVDTLKEVGELCDSANLEKETLKIPVEHLENLKKALTL